MREPIRQLLQEAIKAAWASSPPFPVIFDNGALKEDGDAWGRFSLQFGETEASAVGPTFERTYCLLYLQVFVKPETGTRAANLAADRLKASFLFKRLQTTEAGRVAYLEFEGGPDGPGQGVPAEKKIMYTLSMRFRYDEGPA